MIASLFALLALSAQPAQPSQAQVQAEAEVQVQTPAGNAQADVEAAADAAAQEPQEEIVCRRRLRPSERVGQRHRVVRDCRPKSEWENSRNRGD